MQYIYAAISFFIMIIGAVLFLYNFKGLKNYFQLYRFGQVITYLITIVSATMIVSGALYTYKNLTYQAPKVDALTTELKNNLSSDKKRKTYKQKITNNQYQKLSDDDLYNKYTKKGKADLESYAVNSPKTKSLMLHNIGKKITSQKLIDINGASINLRDGKNRVIMFVDDSQYSINQIQLFTKYISSNTNANSNLSVVLVFPTVSGLDVDQFITDNALSSSNISLVTTESMDNNLNLKNFAVNQFNVQNLPSYISIDNDSYVSNAGVGSIFNTTSELQTYLSRSFGSNIRLYTEIK